MNRSIKQTSEERKNCAVAVIMRSQKTSDDYIAHWLNFNAACLPQESGWAA